MAFKTGKPRILAYLASVGVDAARHVITHIHADLADWRDSRYLLAVVEATQQRLQTFGLHLSSVVADAGYCSGENYEQLEARGLTGYIPAHGMYKAERTGFTYDAASDSYTCSQGNQLTFHQVFVDPEGHAKKRYLAKAADCKRCPIGEQCKGKKAKEKRLHHTPHKAHYDRMLARLATQVGKRMRRLRAATVQLNYQLLWLLPTHLGLAVARPTRRWRQYASVAAGLLILSGLFGWIVYYAHLLPVVGLLLLVLLLQLVLFIRPVSSRSASMAKSAFTSRPATA